MSRPPTSTSHRLRPLLGRPPGTLVIHEIYRSLQGEGLHAGMPCTFVRLTACHLRCRYCDTPHAFTEGETTPLDAVLERALATSDELVEITGGEPLLQPEVLPLMSSLADAGRTVLLETSGACDTSAVDARVRILLDLKTPGSGEAASIHWPNFDRLRPIDEVKIVVCDRADFDWAVDRVRSLRLTQQCAVLVAPAFGRVEPAELAAWILESRLPLRLQLQLHKLLWGADRRGV